MFKKYGFPLWLLLLPFFVLGQNLDLPEPPRSSIFVNDYAELLDPAKAQALQETLKAYSDTTGQQLVVVTIPSLQGASIRQYGQALAEYWGIGQSDADNGLLLLVARIDRKMSIEVGYGLERVITDLEAQRVLDELLRPDFKAGNYDQGLSRAMHKLMEMAQGLDYTPAPETPLRLLFYLLLPFLVIGPWVLAIKQRQVTKPYAAYTVFLVFFVVFLEINYKKWFGHENFIGLAMLGGALLAFLLAYAFAEIAEKRRSLRHIGYFIKREELFDKLRHLYLPQQIDATVQRLKKEFEARSARPPAADMARWQSWKKDLNFLNFNTLHRKRFKSRDFKSLWTEEMGANSFKKYEKAQHASSLFVAAPSGAVYQLRSDYVLRQIARKLEKRQLLQQNIYQKQDRLQIQAALQKDLERFAPYSLKSEMPEAHLEAYQKRLAFYENVLEAPQEVLPLDYEQLWAEVQDVFTETFWKKLQSDFTQRSVQKQRAKIEQQLHHVRSLEPNSPQAQPLLQQLYFEERNALLEKPGKRGLLVHRPQSRYRSRSSSSFSSSGSSFSSSSSFGGGSFGGGGASSSW